MPGVVRTRVGYAGGKTDKPTYHTMGDHSETVQIDFDPDVVTYRDLLDVFWQDHDPGRRPWSRQYAAIVFYHNDTQKKLAEEARARAAATAREGRIYTEIVPYSGFVLAEDYHQKHALQRYPEFMEEFLGFYPSLRELTASTAAARVNGYLGGDGACGALERELDGFGLSPARRESLRKIVCGENVPVTCPLPK
jgi:methionine-S-sulfoxide reductase